MTKEELCALAIDAMKWLMSRIRVIPWARLF